MYPDKKQCQAVDLVSTIESFIQKVKDSDREALDMAMSKMESIADSFQNEGGETEAALLICCVDFMTVNYLNKKL